MKAKKKRGVEAPPKVKAFINSVQSTPLANIQNPLAGFHWDYDKGDFYHWVELLNHFEVFFETFIKPRKDLQLEGNFLEGDDTFPKEAVLQILRVTQIILENCANKYLYNSNEHVSSLFASTDPDIVVAALQTLAAFVKKPVQSNRGMRWHGDAALNACLFSLSQGWGGKEEGLGLLACAIENGCDPDACKLGATLHFEFYAEGGDASHYNHQAKSTGLQVIHICDLHRRSEGDLELLRQLVEQYKVPPNLRFMLLTRLRFARAFVNLNLRRQYICIRLLAFTVLLQSSPDHEDLTAFFINEPEFVDELVSLLRCEETVPEDIRILALLALAAQTQDRPRQSNILTVISAGGHRGILPSLMQKAVGSIMAGTPGYSVSFVEALLSLVTVLVSSSTGAAALREAGLIPTILPLLQDMDPQHNHLVTAAVHNLEAFMDYSNPAGTLFRDLGGLDDAVARLKVEVARIEEWTQRRRAEVQVDINNVSPMVEDMELQQQSASGQSDTFIPYHQRLLLKALLRAIALGTYAPDNARLHRSEESALPACLCIIFRNAKEFGGGVFSLAASVMSDLIHKDPTCFSALNAAGLPAAFLDAIATGVLPSSEAVGCIPNSLDALCLNNAGLQAVRDRNALGCFVKIFTSKAYLRALTNDTPGSLASGIDELMRHAPSLRGAGIDMCIGILKTIAVIGGAAVEPTATDTVPELDSASSPAPMDTDAGEKSGGQVIKDNRQQNPAPSQQSSNPASDGATPNVEAFLSECINNTVRLLETLLQNADSSRVFIEKKGIEALLQLYMLPHLPVSFGGSSTAHNMAITFRSFSPQHSAALARVVCTGMREHLKVALHQLPLMSGRKLSDLDSGLQNKVARSLGVVECYLTLSTVLVRSSSAMMAELSTATSDVLQIIGKIQREVFWQISMLDNVKVDVEEVSRNRIATSVGVGTGSGEGEDETDSYPVVRSVNQVQLRNSPSSHWGLEPDFLPILHGGDGPFRHSRRDHAASAEALTQMARMGQLARHAESIQLDLEAVASLAEPAAATESAKQKSPESLNLEMMERLSMAAHSLYIALGKVMVVPSRRRDDTVPLSAAAKSVAATLAILLRDNLSFNGNGAVLQKESDDAVKCRYLGKVVDDISELVFDSRRRTCNNFLVNNLVGHGAIQQILTTFGVITQLLWIQLQNSKHFHMETESTQSEGERTGELHSWLVDTLQNYSRLLEHLVTSSLLLTPASMAQMLICPVSGVSDPVAKDPATFVGNLQAQVLDVVLPVWNHAMFPHCNAAFINSVVAIITHIYTGVGHTKGSRTQGVSGGGLRLIGPPPDESSVSRIVEMGFSRTRAEEALRRVDSNSVEMAMEWLFSHPEEAPQEDDELAQALAMSLNNDGLLKADARDGNKGKEVVSQEEGPRAPSIVDMLSTCISLLQKSDVAAFSLADLLVTMCNRNKGRDRLHVVSFLAQQLKSQRGEASVGDNSALSTIAHTLALVLNEDSTAREVAAENGLVCTALEILESFTPVRDAVKPDVPKWVTALLLVLDHMLQYKGDINVDASGGSAATVAGSSSVALSSEESPSEGQRSEVDNVQQQKNGDPFGAILGNLTGYMTDDEQCKAVAVATGFLHMQLPSATVQAVLQLCARLTKKHNIAMQFLDAGGLTVLLGLPRRSMFPGFDSLAASIIRHILEDPHTLQQAMESEIRHTLITSLSRQNGRLSPRMFLTAMAPVVSRNPTIFMLAASTVCQIEMVGGRPTVIMAKEKEQEKENDKDKEHEKNQHMERVQDKQLEKPKMAALCVSSETGAATDGGMKAHELSRKSGKAHHHKKIPHSFSQVIDQLLEVILHYPLQVLEQPGDKEQSLLTKEDSIPMDVDDFGIKDKGKGQAEDGLKPSGTETDSDISEDSAALAKVTFVMKLTTEVLLMYASAVSVVLRRDSESSQGRGPSQGGAEVIGHGGLLYHVLQRLLSYPEVKPLGKKNDKEWREKLSDKAAYFLMAVCVRSGQGRRRVVVEIVRALTSACPATERSNTEPSKGVPQPPPGQKLQALVDLVNSILSSHAPAANAQGPGFSAFMAKTMMDAGMVQALTHTLQAIDLDHPDTPKLVNSILKALEILTRSCSSIEQVFRADGGTQKRVTGGRGAEQRIPVVNEALGTDVRGAEGSQAQTSQQTQESLSQEALPHDATALLPVGSVDNHVEEQMEHDRADRGTSEEAFLEVEAEAEEEFMREAAEDVAAEMAYGLEPVAGDEIADEEDDEVDMDDGDGEDNGEEEDEDEEEDDDEDDMEGDEGVPHLSPHDTDVEDHDDNGLGDEYEDMMEEDEDDDWQEDRVIEVRWRDGLTGLNRVQVLGHTGASNLVDFSGDPFQGMNMDDLFGSSRRPGGGDRRRAATYRALAERYSGGDRGVAFHHPLLTRPATTPGMGGSTISGLANNSLLAGTGSVGREAEAALGGGALDVTHLYMYDGAMLEHPAEGVFGERGVGAPPPPLLDFSMDPVYLFGRRGGRPDGRLNSWVDDGQLQAGAQATAVAQAIEEQFISQLRTLAPGEGHPLANPPADNTTSAGVESTEARVAAATETLVEGVEPDASTQTTDNSEERAHGSDTVVGASNVEAENASTGSGIRLRLEREELVPGSNVMDDADVQMCDERSDRVVRDTEGGSQDSGGSGATVGESLRSLEVEIGSADGHEDGERHAGAERLGAPGVQPQGGVDSDASRDRRAEQAGVVNGDMEGAGIVGQQVDDAEETEAGPGVSFGQVEVASIGVQGDGHAASTGQHDGEDATVSSIDPTFLEALPADLRAEVLASRQTLAARPPNPPPPPAEEIDPEFLAALPPDIQAEVLAQQRAPRAVIAAIEAQPVDMDSASIIATFPAELRQEVLLTSSEAVLAALPPALLAEAQLLRERAMSQYQARGLFGGAHRIRHRQNSLGIGGGTETAALDRAVGVGAGTGITVGHRPLTPSSSTRIKEDEGSPLVDTDALKAILRLIRLAQPLGKGLLQRLLLNLCAHSVTRVTLLQLLLDMLCPEAEGGSREGCCTDGGQSQRLYGCNWNVVYARSQLSDGVPPLVSRRVLEILTYLARSLPIVNNVLLYMEPVGRSSSDLSDISPPKVMEKGKGKLVDGFVPAGAMQESRPKGEIPLILLLKLLNQPLYSRSSAHLEQVMGLLEVVTTHAGAQVGTKAKAQMAADARPPASVSDTPASISDLAAVAVTSATADGGSSQPEGLSSTTSDTVRTAGTGTEGGDGTEPSISGSDFKVDTAAILLSLPEQELRNLCKLLAREGLSDTAYTRVAEVLKKLATAAPPHRRLFVADLADAARSLSDPAIEELCSLGDVDGVVASRTSMAGAAMLRVLQALSALTSSAGSASEKDKGQGNSVVSNMEQEEGMMLVRELNGALDVLWHALSGCIGKIEGRLGNVVSLSTPAATAATTATVIGTGMESLAPSLPPGTQRVLPFVEAFFLLCEKLRSGPPPTGRHELNSATARESKEAEASSSGDLGLSMPSTTTLQQKKSEGEKGMTFTRFADRHRRLLNAFVRQNPGLLEKSLGLMLKTPRLIDFDNKRAYFRSRIRQQHEQQHYAPLRICVRRAYLLEDSYNQLRMRTPDELKGRLTVQFQGEEGIDAGGLTREWYQLLSRVTFDKGALLFTTVGNESTFQPNPNSVYQTEHLSYFKFVGRVVAKALFDGQLLDVYFTRSFYKHILGVKVTYHDIEAIDPDYFKNLKWMLENDITDILDLTFSMDADEEKHILYEKTEVTDYELIPGGCNIRVTEENKHEYVDRVAEHRLTTAIRPQITAFLEGFNELVAHELISIFNDKEMELLISGLPEIDLEDLKANTEYTGYTAGSPIVQWFWDVVGTFNKEDMARLLQFITGTSKVPLEGFRALQGISGPQRFQIHKAYGAPERLPSAHTCFNQLDLPDYASKEQLQERLLLAIHEGSEGFGFG